MFLPELGKQIQGERDLSSNNRIIRISAGSNNRESTVKNNENTDESTYMVVYVCGANKEEM